MDDELGDTTTLSDSEPRDDARWSVVVVHHPGSDSGRRVDVPPEGWVASRRGLDDAHVSREHARFVAGATLRVEDLGSHNGTFVNGTRLTEERELVPGDVVGVGRVLLLVERGAPPHTPEIPGLVVHSGALAHTVATVRKFARGGHDLLLYGESGTGKRSLAAIFAEAAGARTKVCLELSEVSPSEQQGLAAHEARIVACHRDAKPKLAPALAARLHPWAVRVPPLRERPVDVVPLAHRFATQFDEQARPLGAELTYRLVRHRWPGNIPELGAIIERTVVESDGAELDTFPDLDALLAAPRSSEMISTHTEASVSGPLVVHRDGQWYTTPDGTRHDLSKRKTLATLLAGLAADRLQQPGHPLSMDDLLALAWPDEKPLRRAGANRVYVALTTLRKKGLRAILARNDDGYFLDPAVELTLED